MALVLGIHCGTSATKCVAMEAATMKVLGRGDAGCANRHSAGRDAALRELWAAIKACLATCRQQMHDVGVVCIGMAALDLQEEGTSADIVASLQPSFLPSTKIVVHDEAVLTLSSGTNGQLQGCVVIAGAGTATLAIDGSARARAAGWGPVFMDGGSGWDLASRALSAMCKAHDGRGAFTSLVQVICSRLQVTTPLQLLNWAYADSDWTHIAALAPLVVECASKGDPVADTILKHGVGELFRSIKAVVDKVGLGHRGQPFKVVMAGALLVETSLYAQYLEEAIKDNLPSAVVVHALQEPAVAAAQLATQQLSPR